MQVRVVTLARSYATSVEDLWDAITNPERLPRWFLEVTGDLKQGGRYQLQGNAGGTILVCRPPEALDLTWEFASTLSWVDVRLSAEAEGARLVLSHIAEHPNEFVDKYGSGAGGIGWDLGLLGLAHHLDNPSEKFNEEELAASPQGRSLIADVGAAWGEADIAAGDDPEKARAAAARSIAFFSGEAQ
ncbi:SRPBCC family protein [Pelagibacterium halotolerans]|nr:SRPBCC family protein [Pelagibacterium halotolerans]